MVVKVDVFISGAGPVGLFFAYQMALRGHSIYICDTKSGPTTQSRALFITARSMEILESKGLADEILTNAFIACGMRLHRDGQVIGKIDACGDTPFPYTTILPQGQTEDIINARLESDTDYKVHWKTELVSYTQSESGVTSITKNMETGKEETIESKYIIGADGSHSTVRKGNSDWTYGGSTVKTKFALADLNVKGNDINRMKDRMNVFTKDAHIMGVVPIMPPTDSENNENVFRIFWNVEAYKLSEEDTVSHGLRSNEASPTIEFIQEWVDKITHPFKFEVDNLIWSSFFKINERIANGFRRDKAFLIGDAAHCHSPAGGQGMNLGLQDADNLAWKISEVLRGTIKDPEGLLDSYNEERYPHVKSTVDTTSNATEFGITDNSRVLNYIRFTLLSTALLIPQIRQFSFKTVNQQNLTIDVKESKFMGDSDKGLIKAGRFVPDTDALQKTFTLSSSRVKKIQRKTLRELVSQGEKYAVIFVSTCPASTLPNASLIEKFWKNTESYPVKRFVIQSAWHCHFMRQLPDYVSDKKSAEEAFYTEIRFDVPTSVTQRIGLFSHVYSSSAPPPCALLVVRPDMYVAQTKLLANEEELVKSLEFVASLFT